MVTAGATLAIAMLAFLAAAAVATDDADVRVGFASCNKHDKDQSYWSVVRQVLQRGDGSIDGFVWLGDVIYADRSPFPGVWVPEELSTMQSKLKTFKTSPNYAGLLTALRPTALGGGGLMGVWDDHDMGKNDGGKEFVHREAMQQAFLDFLDVPVSSPRRGRRGLFSLQGLKAFPSSTTTATNDSLGFTFALCVLLLDARFHRDPIGSNGDMLGAEQWAWLAQVLANPAAVEPHFDASKSLASQCAVTVIGSGVQVLGDEKPTEHWGHFPTSRFKLLTLLRDAKMERFFFISGDVHYAEVQVEDPSPFGFPLVDVTSSGLTHAVGSSLPPWLFDWACQTPRRRGRFLQKNFGVIAISGGAAPVLTVTVRDLESGATVLNFSRRLEELRYVDGAEWRDIAVHSGPLKTVLWTVRQALFPSMPVHKLLTGFVGLSLVVIVISVGLTLRWCVKKVRGKSSSAVRSRKCD